MGALPQVREPAVLSAAPAAALISVPEPQLITTHPSAVPNWSVRIPALDGLRGIAIVLVLMRHTIFGMQTDSRWLSKFLAAGQLTWSGVDLFFVLSGFLIGGILLDARNSPRYFKTFYIRRAYRIFPLYAVITALFLFRHLPFRILPGPLGDHSPLAIPWWAYVTLTQNFGMAHIGWFGERAMLVTWSLAIEEQFYLTIPFLVRKLQPERLLVVLVSVVIGAPLLRELVFFSLPHGPFACFVLMPCRADALCLGVLSAFLVRNPRGWELLQIRRKTLYAITGVFFAGIVFVAYMQYGQLSNLMTTLGYSWVAFFYTGCLLVVMSRSKGKVQSALCNRVLMWLGTLAYCTYLIHVPLSEVGRRVLALKFPEAPSATWLLGGLLGVAASLVVANLSWKYFEKPLLRRGHTYNY